MLPEFKSKPIKGLNENLEYTDELRAKQSKLNLKYTLTEEATTRSVKNRAKTMEERYPGNVWGDKISRAMKEKDAAPWKGKSGKDHNTYGRGLFFIELTTGFIGTMSDTSKKFNFTSPSSLYRYVERDKPISKGPNKGLHFQIYKP